MSSLNVLLIVAALDELRLILKEINKLLKKQ